MDECLKKGAEGRKYSISLQSLEYSGDLANQLMSFSNKMETVYRHLQDLRSRKVTNQKAYEKHFMIIDEKLAWFSKAEAHLRCSQIVKFLVSVQNCSSSKLGNITFESVWFIMPKKKENINGPIPWASSMEQTPQTWVLVIQVHPASKSLADLSGQSAAKALANGLGAKPKKAKAKKEKGEKDSDKKSNKVWSRYRDMFREVLLEQRK